MADTPPLDLQTLHRLLETIPDLIFILDAEGQIVYANRDELGIPLEESLGRPVFQFVAPGSEGPYRAALRKALETGAVVEHEGAAQDTQGNPRWYRTWIVPIQTNGGETLLASIAQDVTARREAERARNRSDAILQAVAAVAHLFLTHRRWTDVMDEALARLGQATEVSRAYLFQTYLADDGTPLLDQRFEWTAPDTEPQIDNPEMQSMDLAAIGHERWRNRFMEGKLVAGVVAELPESERPVLQEQEIQSVAVVPVFVDGAWWGCLGFDDCYLPRQWSQPEQEALQAAASALGGVIQRARAEQGIRERERHYRRLVQTSPYTVYAVDDQGRMTELNRAGEELLARSAGEVIGSPFARLFAPADLGKAVEAYEQTLSGQVPGVEVELRIQRPSGELRQIHLAATPIHGDGRIVGAHGIARDITDEQIREEHLKRAERLASLGTLVGGVAHELNNPLTSIQGMVQLLMEEDRSADELEMLQTISREAQRSARIVDNLRLLTRRSHEPSGHTGELDLNEVVEHVLKVRQYPLETHNVHVTRELAESHPPVTGDPSQLEQVLLNLVVNAEQALAQVDRERHLTIGTGGSERGAILWVQDNGPGISPEHLDQLFDPFWTTKDPDKGTGLGLSLVHNIVTEHRGQVEVESEPDRGARFVVHLPVAHAGRKPGTPPGLRSGRPSMAGDGQPRTPDDGGDAEEPARVLVVDDEAGIRQVLHRLLIRDGHQVELARDGEEALGRVADADSPFHLVLTDLRMPGIGGEEFLTRLLSEDPEYEGRVVFMTGDVSALNSRGRIGRGAAPTVRKPFRLQEIQELAQSYGRRFS